MSGFYAGVPDAWAIASEHIPTPWDESCAVNDLRWWAAIAASGERDGLPSLRELSQRWGWSGRKVRALRNDVTSWAAAGEHEACAKMADRARGRAPHSGARSLPVATLPDGSPGGGVYVVRGRITGRVKVGVSTDVARRVRDMQTGCSETLDILLVVSGGRELEDQIHEYLSMLRVHGEWFNMSDSGISGLLRRMRGDS